MNRISGKSFDVRIMGIMVHVESFTLNIEDGSVVSRDKGIPNGQVLGDMGASGELELDIRNVQLLTPAAAAAGSWRNIDPFTIDAYAGGTNSTGPEGMHVRAFGCKFRISELLNIDPNSTDKSTVKLPYDVTDPDFVWINGVPYLDSSEFSLI